MELKSFTFNPFSENTYVLSDVSNCCVIIDPGCATKEEVNELTDYIAQNNLKPELVLNTHGHIDHVLGNAAICEKYNIPLALHIDDLPTLQSVKVYAGPYGFAQYQEKLPDQYLAAGTPVTFGNTSLEVLFVPGHAPGHVAFYHAPTDTLIGGDVLFKRSIGRTDLPGGDFDTLIKSIKEVFFTLPNQTKVYSGHGPSTTIGEEKLHNPFCAVS